MILSFHAGATTQSPDTFCREVVRAAKTLDVSLPAWTVPTLQISGQLESEVSYVRTWMSPNGLPSESRQMEIASPW